MPKDYPHLCGKNNSMSMEGVTCQCCALPAIGTICLAFNKSNRETFVVCTVHSDMAEFEPKRFCDHYWQYDAEART